MAKVTKVTRITFRFSEASLDVIHQHMQRYGFVEYTEALEDILKQYAKWENRFLSRFKNFLAGDPNIKPLETFQQPMETFQHE